MNIFARETRKRKPFDKQVDTYISDFLSFCCLGSFENWTSWKTKAIFDDPRPTAPHSILLFSRWWHQLNSVWNSHSPFCWINLDPEFLILITSHVAWLHHITKWIKSLHATSYKMCINHSGITATRDACPWDSLKLHDLY